MSPTVLAVLPVIVTNRSYKHRIERLREAVGPAVEKRLKAGEASQWCDESLLKTTLRVVVAEGNYVVVE